MTATADIGLAARHYAARDYPSTEAACRDILRHHPDHFDALHLLGVVLDHQDRHADALGYLRRAAAINRHNAQLQTNLCNAAIALKQYDAAMAAGAEALRLAPDDPAALCNLGLVHKGLDQRGAAIEAFRRAIAVRWDHVQALYNLGVVLGQTGQAAEALAVLQRAQQVAPLDTPVNRLADISNEIGRMFLMLGRPADAIVTCRQFLRRHPREQSVRWNLSLALLLTEAFAEGWAAYESRWGLPDHDPQPSDVEIIDPAAVSGRRVLILTEQGRGDMLQFIRYAPLLFDRGATVIVQAYPDLVALLAGLRGQPAIVSTDDAPPEAEHRISLMSLPLAFGTVLETVPAAVPYLSAPADRIAAWASRLGRRCRRRIGLAWSGSRHSYDRSAMPASALAPLLRLAETEWHCLQTEINDADRAWLTANDAPVYLHATALRDFADTAAIISQLDAVVTIDTAVSHLAGAMARPVHIMLPFNPDFRWLLGRATSPWYPTARLYRQPRPGDWDAVVQDVAAALADTAR